MYIHDSKGNSSPVLAAQSRWGRHAIHILLPIWFRCQELSVSPGYSRLQASCAALITGLSFLNLALCWYQKNSCAWLNPWSHLGLSHLSLLREAFLCWIWSRQLTCLTIFQYFFDWIAISFLPPSSFWDPRTRCLPYLFLLPTTTRKTTM